MSRSPSKPIRPVFHAPMRLDWTDDKLKALSQEQLLNLLDNLDQQREIGRLSDDAAAAFDQRIVALLTRANGSKRRKKVALAAAEAAAASGAG
jgi:hypothetical protein